MSALKGKRIPRDRSNRVISGLAGGIATRMGVESLVVRIAFCLLLLPAGIGAVLYLSLLALSKPVFAADIERRPVNDRHTAGVCAIVVGLFVIALSANIGLSPRNSVFGVLMIAGAFIVWPRDQTSSTFAWKVAGLATFSIGAIGVASGLDPLATQMAAVLTIGIVGSGLLFLVGPWLHRLSDEAARERRARIRGEERAEISAQLHDSVLQTLAVMQRSDSLDDVKNLARRQERQLRSWMIGQTSSDDDALRSIIRATAAEIETREDVRVDVVVVGETAIDDRVRALLDATKEAITNAAHHSGAPVVDVYIECTAQLIEAFIRDDGSGFDSEQIDKARRGIAESIVGRMERVEGTALIRSTPGDGTEVHLRLPKTAE